MSSLLENQSQPLDLASAGRVIWQFNGIEFNETTLELTIEGQLVEVEPKPIELLMFLLRRSGEVVTREEILSSLWPGRVLTDGAITNCVAKLRTALRDDGQIVRTVPRYGYRLVADVQRARGNELHIPSNDLLLKAGDDVPSRPGWKLEKQLSSGAHGEVWLAVYQSTEEKRVIKFGRDVESLSSIKREITLFRVLEETLGSTGDFVSILGWNLEEPPFFIESEYSPHGNLIDWCHQQGGVEKLAMETRIELAAQCASAIAAAHSAGVLHKDLKPSNILIRKDQDNRPKISLCDFASGHVLDPARLSDLNITRIGFTQLQSEGGSGATPLYQAPELMAGQPPTVQSDIYALGVILFQLVVGDFKRVLSPGWEEEINDPLLREDIATAAAGDPRRRLTDASALALRLRSLQARRAEFALQQRNALDAERARQMLLRANARRGPLIALVSVLMVGLCISLGLARNWQQAVVKEQQSARTTHAVTQFLTEDLLAPANAELGHAADVTIGMLLDHAAASIDTRFAADPRTHAALQRVLGMNYAALSETEKALPLLLAAETELSQLESPAAEDVLTIRMALQSMLINRPRTSTNLDLIRAVAQRQIDAIDAAGDGYPAFKFTAQVGIAVVDCWRKAGTIRGANCGGVIDDIISNAEKTLGPHDPVTLRLKYNRASLLGVSGRVDNSVLVQFRDSLDGLEKIHGRGSPKLSLLLQQMSKALEYGGDPKQTIPLLQRAIRDFSTTLGKDHPYLWNARRAIGVAYVRAGDYQKAIDLQTEQLQQVTARYGADSRERLTALRFLAAAELAANDLNQASKRISEGLMLNERVPDGTYDAIELRDFLATIRERQQRHNEAQKILHENLENAIKQMPGADVPIGRYSLHLARLLFVQGQREEAHKLASQALERFNRVLDPSSDLVVSARELQQRTAAARISVVPVDVNVQAQNQRLCNLS